MKLDKRMEDTIDSILKSYEDDKEINRLNIAYQPDKKSIIEIVKKLMKILYPGYYRDKVYRQYGLRNNMAATIEDAMYNLNKQVAIVLRHSGEYEDLSEQELNDRVSDITFDFMGKLPGIRELLEKDTQAFYDGDPAAGSKAEVLLAYPGLFAVSVYRMAHELYLLKVPVIPRIMTEYAHGETGIDIHPGAVIGEYFFIDHGTGIVIGETTIIGNNVKIYQGVTLGGLSTKGGQSIRGSKRHPTIGNNVTIYSGASILGGNTVVEDDVVIGGNAFVTESVTKGSRVVFKG